MSYMFEYWGSPKTHQKIVPGNNACGTLATSYYYTEWSVAFTSGGTTVAAVGDWIVGATSAVTAQLVALTVTNADWAGGNGAGTMRLRSAFHATTITPTWTSAEKFKIAAGTDDGTLTLVPKIGQARDLYKFPMGQPAKCALVTVLTNTALVCIDGSTPNQTALVGFPMKDGSSILLRDMEEIINFKCIDYVASSASVVNIDYFF